MSTIWDHSFHILLFLRFVRVCTSEPFDHCATINLSSNDKGLQQCAIMHRSNTYIFQLLFSTHLGMLELPFTLSLSCSKSAHNCTGCWANNTNNVQALWHIAFVGFNLYLAVVDTDHAWKPCMESMGAKCVRGEGNASKRRCDAIVAGRCLDIHVQKTLACGL
jgi:hypothetical protein